MVIVLNFLRVMMVLGGKLTQLLAHIINSIVGCVYMTVAITPLLLLMMVVVIVMDMDR